MRLLRIITWIALSTTTVIPILCDQISIPVKDLEYFARNEAAKRLDNFVLAVENVERLYHKIYPVKPPKVETDPDAAIDGNKIVNITFEYLDHGFRSRITRVKLMLKLIMERGNTLPDKGEGQNNFQTFGFKDEDQAIKWLRMLENLYQMIHEQKYRLGSLHRWIEQDLIKGDPKNWAKNPLSVAMKIVHARINLNNPKMVEFNSFQRHLWTSFLEETEDIFADLQTETDTVLKLFLANKLPLAKATSFEFDFDFRPHLQRFSDWFNGWYKGVRFLRETYEAIPTFPKAPLVHYLSVGHLSKEPDYDTNSRSSILSSFNIYEPPSALSDISAPLRVEQLAYEPDPNISCTELDGGVSKIPEVNICRKTWWI
ncbi:hypothetical protein TWF694_000461 [Orbilia ellipsospora]|uniref:Secreted protein n=1 Tax=Orbilia ellipsospora TaxID=2528407 RepID=A0AAV9XS16_9PEZI